jgi:hypothetical protein
MNTKVFAYRNLNRKGIVWSIKDCKTNLVIDRVCEAYFKDVELKVSEAGRQRVLKQKKKNVHAGVKGYRLKSRPPIEHWVHASYNPYKQENFIDAYGNLVKKVKYAMLDEEGLWISV